MSDKIEAMRKKINALQGEWLSLRLNGGHSVKGVTHAGPDESGLLILNMIQKGEDEGVICRYIHISDIIVVDVLTQRPRPAS